MIFNVLSILYQLPHPQQLEAGGTQVKDYATRGSSNWVTGTNASESFELLLKMWILDPPTQEA